VKSGTALPKGVLQSERRPEVADAEVFLRFNGLVRQAATELSVLGQDPVAVAASPNRFNDAWSMNGALSDAGPSSAKNNRSFPNTIWTATF
jgi:hypothetical protein